MAKLLKETKASVVWVMTAHILVVDDNPCILEAFAAYFSTIDDLVVVGTAFTGRQALQWLKTNACDLVLSDIRMPDIDGIELLRCIQHSPQPPLFVAMTAFDTDETMLKCLSLGAVGYIIKGWEPESIIHSLRDAIHGGTALSASCLNRLVNIKNSNERRDDLHIPKITKREQVVLSMLCEGKTNGEISKSMHLAEVTIRKTLSALFCRFSAKNRVELAVKYQSIKGSNQK